MPDRPIFHLSIPVAELDRTRTFYVDVLGATVGREHDDWMDILLWGHQITLQRSPADVVPLREQGKRHFGVVLPWADWEREAARIKATGVPFLREPTVLRKGTEQEQAKFHLHDPSNNIIEIKAYRDTRKTLGLQPS